MSLELRPMSWPKEHAIYPVPRNAMRRLQLYRKKSFPGWLFVRLGVRAGGREHSAFGCVYIGEAAATLTIARVCMALARDGAVRIQRHPDRSIRSLESYMMIRLDVTRSESTPSD